MPYAFNPDGYSEFSGAILAAEGDQATLTSVLADMQGTFVEGVAAQAALQADYDRLKAENDRLLTANSQLFLRVGQQINRENGFNGTYEQEEEKPMGTAEYMKKYFDSLNK